MPGEWLPVATLQASGSAWGAIREAFLRIVMHAGPKAAIDGYTRRQPYSPKVHWISCPSEKDEVIHALWDLVTVLRKEVVELKAEVANLKAEVTDLRGQLAKNSRNSSIPSSAEGLKKTKSMRKKGTRPPGGQPGHSGSTVERIADAVAQAEVVGADESGFRMAGKLNWLHAAVTDALTWLGLHAKRGKIAFEHFGLLYRHKGTLVHDGWASYRELDCAHALCNAHHLRELTFVHEECRQLWAKRMIDLLVAAHHETVAAQGQPLTAMRIRAIRAGYETVLVEAATANPERPASGKRRRTAQSVPFNLYRRLRDHADDAGWFRRIRRRRKSRRTHSGKAWRQRQQCQGGSKAGAVGSGVS